MAFYLVGRTGFEPVTSSVSVQGSYLAGNHDLVMGGSDGEPRRVVVSCRCCHFCCHIAPVLRPPVTDRQTMRLNRPIGHAGGHGSVPADRIPLWPVSRAPSGK